MLAPVSLFVSVYLATFLTAGFLLRPWVQWSALLSVTVATAITVRLWEHGRWNLGFFTPAAITLREFVLGLGFAALLIGTCAAVILLLTDVRERWSGGFPRGELLSVFLPAALHEELAFRGYVYQKLRQWSRGAAIAISAAVFAMLHSGNSGVGWLAIANILIAGVLLALAYERFRRLWFPIGIHLGWNILSGPVLGFPVSGFVTRQSLLRVSGSGPLVVTGGLFGIEASVCMTVVELLGILVLLNVERRMQNAE